MPFLRIFLVVSVAFSCLLSSAQVPSSWNALTPSSRLDSLISRADELLYEDQSSCIVFCDLAIALATELDFQEQVAYSIQTKSLANRLIGNYDSALIQQNMALTMWQSMGDSSNIAGAFNNLGIIYDERGINDQAITYYLDGLQMYEQIGSLEGMAKAYNNLGIVNKKEGNYQKVLEYYEKSLAIYQQLNHQIGITITYGNLGSVHLELKDFESAIDYSKRAIDAYLENGLDQYVAYSQENIGIAYRGLGELAKAEKYHLDALDNYIKYGNEKEAAFTRGSLASIYCDTDKLSLAESFARRSLDDSRRMGLLDEQLRATEVLFNVARKTGAHTEVLEYHDMILELKDSLSNSQKVKTIEGLQMRYETQKKEQEIKTLQAEAAYKELEVSQTRYLMMVVGLMAVAIVGAVMLSNSRKRYKMKAQLAEEKEQLQKERFKAVIDAEEGERKRIARELHDGLGQLLSTTRITVSSLKSDANKQKLDNSLKLIDHAVKEVRSISHNMMPNALVSFGLDAALDDMFRQVGESEHLQVHKTRHTDLVLTESKSIAVYRVCQEVINNTLKYAKAKNIYVIIDRASGVYEFTLRDDGVGFDSQSLAKSDGIGWDNIRSRIDVIGGEMNILSNLGQGTTVTFTVPYD